jgi:hypothetical protein
MNAVWVKSSLSFSNGNCVEVAELPGDSVGVRNSRDPEGPVLKFTQDEWDAFLGGAQLGEFDRFGSTASRPGDADDTPSCSTLASGLGAIGSGRSPARESVQRALLEVALLPQQLQHVARNCRRDVRPHVPCTKRNPSPSSRGLVSVSTGAPLPRSFRPELRVTRAGVSHDPPLLAVINMRLLWLICASAAETTPPTVVTALPSSDDCAGSASRRNRSARD